MSKSILIAAAALVSLSAPPAVAQTAPAGSYPSQQAQQPQQPPPRSQNGFWGGAAANGDAAIRWQESINSYARH